MVIDISNITKMGNNEIVSLCHKSTAIPSILIIYISTLIILFFVGIISIKKSKDKFLIIFGLTVLLSLIILLGVIFLPNIVQNIANPFM